MTHGKRPRAIAVVLCVWCASLLPLPPVTAADQADIVLAPIMVEGSTAPVPTAPGLASALKPLAKGGVLGEYAVFVGDPATSSELIGMRAGSSLQPASTMKLLTAATALRVLGPMARLATRAVRSGQTVTIIGGGDATLRSTGGGASLATLAKRVARNLPAGPIDLTFDISLFKGRTLASGWSRSFPAEGVVAPVQALMADQGRARPGGNARVAEPARQAAELFAGMLAARGVTVRSLAAGKAPVDATEIARVESKPVSMLVHHLLTDSDNDLAEALAHLAGAERSGHGTFSSAASAVLETASALGVPTRGLILADASGLSSRDRVTPRALGGVLALSARGSLAGVAPALAVAGLTGTLADRFRGHAQRAGRGYVRAKTGTLSSVVALAGLVPDAHGRLLSFVILANQVPSLARARDAVDAMAAVLRDCGCGDVTR